MKKVLIGILFCTALPALAAEYTAPAASAPAAPAVAQPAKPAPTAAAAPAASAPVAAPVAATPSTKSGAVARAQFTTAVENREPVDKLTSLLNDKKQVYFFTEIKDAANTRVTHRWEYQNKTVHELGFDVGGSRWRVYSSVNVQPEQTGDWKVTVLDQSGAALDSQTLKVEAPAAAPVPTPAPAGTSVR